MAGLTFVIDHDELKKHLDNSRTVPGAKKKLHLTVDFDSSTGSIVPTIKANTLHIHDNGTHTHDEPMLKGCPIPPGHC